ncbi:hypothetical protein BD410DRAFT_815646 [Rickenella mellea]|uniref:Uncharacterized protein n=1 Tax=Rickenella mellea TaxID=50990 RepID=A0A4Y7Q051_9AGAM|nr:hypothetical protein BD410DRAFT_815646 [Rickenella mellea]
MAYTVSGTPCDVDGFDLPPRTPLSPAEDRGTSEWEPYKSRLQFEVAEFTFKRAQMPQAQVDTLLELWAASLMEFGADPPFANHSKLHETIDSTKLGDVPWDLTFRWGIDYAPYREVGDHGERRYTNLMSGDWSWTQADVIAEDESTYGALFVPIVLGSDKTTVSAATGQTDYYPLYASIGNVHNGVRRAHRGAVAVIGFLAMPKSEKKYDNGPALRNFRRQLFHASIASILEPLRAGMATPEVTKCPDGHYRRVVYGIGPYIADYPEQVLLTGIAQGWCPRYVHGCSDGLDGGGGRRTQELTELIISTTFPRADIYESIAPDLLHQIIKGTFKDHLVTWVGDYLQLVHGQAGAAVVMSDIDRRGFKQWTGDDSKALMKVYLPAIAGHVPSEIVKTLSAFLDLCYLLRRAIHDDSTLQAIDEALARFHEHRVIFIESGHSVMRYKENIKLFGSPGGLCSSITESKHIKAVKEPWRRSNRYNALGQMLLTNQRLDKLAASRVDFEHRDSAVGGDGIRDGEGNEVGTGDGNDDNESEVDSPKTVGHVNWESVLRGYPWEVMKLGQQIGQPRLRALNRRFLAEQLRQPEDDDFHDIPLSECPHFYNRISVFHFASATFYAPSDLSGINGMRRERIYSCPSWRRGHPRHDCIFVETDATKPGMRGLHVARVKLLFSFSFRDISYPYTPDEDTGMWMVQPELDEEGGRVKSVIHLDTVVRGAHLIGFYGEEYLPADINHYHTLDVFKKFYVNKFIDHHANEIAF